MSMSMSVSLMLSEGLNRSLLNVTQDVVERCVELLASKYNFDANEAKLLIGIIKVESVSVSKSVSKSKSKSKVEKESIPKAAFPLPYNGELRHSCHALRLNSGLYTQCVGEIKVGNYCKSCASQMQKTGAEIPEYGTIEQRMAVGIFEYVDPKGRKPIAYTKIMKKYKVTEEEVLAEAGKMNMEINREHFVVPNSEGVKRGRPKTEKLPKEKGVKGRPKKEKKVIMTDEGSDDLFESLVAQANKSEEVEEEVEVEEVEVEDKEAKLAAKKAEKEAEKEEKAAKKAAEKALAQQKKEEKKAKLAAEKAEKEAKLAAEKEAKLALAEQKKAEKEEKKASKKVAANKQEETAHPQEGIRVRTIEFEGKKYLMSKSTGIVYDYKSFIDENEQVVLGKWSDSLNKILFDDAEESEDEYDEESEDDE